MKYKWKVDYVYSGEMKGLIGQHSVRISFKAIDFYPEEVENYLKGKCRGSISAAFMKGFLGTDIYCKTNAIMVSGLNNNTDDEEIVKETMEAVAGIKEDKKLRTKKKLIKDLEEKHGAGDTDDL